jgi:hypothetical protein
VGDDELEVVMRPVAALDLAMAIFGKAVAL